MVVDSDLYHVGRRLYLLWKAHTQQLNDTVTAEKRPRLCQSTVAIMPADGRSIDAIHHWPPSDMAVCNCLGNGMEEAQVAAIFDPAAAVKGGMLGCTNELVGRNGRWSASETDLVSWMCSLFLEVAQLDVMSSTCSVR